MPITKAIQKILSKEKAHQKHLAQLLETGKAQSASPQAQALQHLKAISEELSDAIKKAHDDTIDESSRVKAPNNTHNLLINFFILYEKYAADISQSKDKKAIKLLKHLEHHAASYDVLLKQASQQHPYLQNIHTDIKEWAKLAKERLANSQAVKPQRAIALRLIAKGEGLAKVLTSKFDLEQVDKKAFDANWDFEFKKMLDLSFRPQRQAFPKPVDGSDLGFSPLKRANIKVDELESNSSEHTVMTSTTLLRPDGKMELFSSNNSVAVGLIFDIRLCDLVGEHFVFDQDALTGNDWWNHPELTKRNQERFKGYTINQLRDEQGFLTTNTEAIPYNEILAGLSKKAIKGIVLHPAATSLKEDLANAIYRKVYVYNKIGKNLPIIMYDSMSKPYEISKKQEKQVLQALLVEHPNNEFLLNLYKMHQELSALPIDNSDISDQEIANTRTWFTLKRQYLLHSLLKISTEDPVQKQELEQQIEKDITQILQLENQMLTNPNLFQRQELESFNKAINNIIDNAHSWTHELSQDEISIINNLLNEADFAAVSQTLQHTLASNETFKSKDRQIDRALTKLETFLNKKDTLTADAAHLVLENIKALHQTKTIKEEDKKKFVEVLQLTEDIVKKEGYLDKNTTDRYSSLANELRYSYPNKGKMLLGAMAAVLGIALIVTAVLLTVATFGAGTPLAIPALALGGSTLAASSTIAATSAVGTSALLAGSFFANKGHQGSIPAVMDDLVNTAKIK